MYKIFMALLVGIMSSGLYAQDDLADGDHIRLVAALDEPEFYCFDLAGWGENLRIEDPLQAHTCKTRGADDQMLITENGHIKIAGQDRCVEVAGSIPVTLPGSAVLARECDADSDLQKLSLDANGRIQLAGTSFCLLAGEDSTPANGPSHMWRTLTVGNCEGADESLSTWQLGLD